MNDTNSESKSSISRRNMLLAAGAALNALGAALIGVPVIGYILSGFTKPKNVKQWIPLGKLAQFPEGETRLAKYRNPFTRPWDGEMGDIPCWVRRLEGEKFQVFAINCTHLGCPVRWFPGSHLFMCPCHGGSFYEDGTHAAGPPPRRLFEYEYKVENGQLAVFGGQLPTLADPLTTAGCGECSAKSPRRG